MRILSASVRIDSLTKVIVICIFHRAHHFRISLSVRLLRCFISCRLMFIVFILPSRWSNMCWNEDDTFYARQALRGKSESFSGNAFQFILWHNSNHVHFLCLFALCTWFGFLVRFHRNRFGLFLFSHSLRSQLSSSRTLYCILMPYIFDTTAPFLA